MDLIFAKQNVILAHCLTKNGGAGNTFSTGKTIYQRIDEVITNQLELSCSTISVGDTLNGKNNFFGPVGVILKKVNVTYANSIDGGTGVDTYGSRDYLLDSTTSPSQTNLENAILNRSSNGYNEICVNQYTPHGLFLCFDDAQYLYNNIDNELLFYKNTNKYNLPFYNLSHGKLINSNFDPARSQFIGSGQFNACDIYI